MGVVSDAVSANQPVGIQPEMIYPSPSIGTFMGNCMQIYLAI